MENATYRDCVSRWKELRGASDVGVREVACVGAPRTLLCVEIGGADRPSVTIAAGTHGDEPAGVIALLHLVEEHRLDTRFSYRLWPCVNPSGFEQRTRESSDGIDINRTFGRGGQSPEAKAIVMANRDRKFALALDLHEDDDATQWYCYAYRAGSIARCAAAAAGGTILTPDPRAESEELGGLSLSLLLLRNAAERVLTLETPSGRPFQERVRLHIDAVVASLEELAALLHL